MTQADPNRVPAGTRALCGAADIGLALMQAAVRFFLLFYDTDVAGINPAIGGRPCW